MAFIKTDMFYLIRFQQRTNCSENEYACVPNSWIVSRADRKVHVAYPKEDSEETKRRAEAKETPGKDWNVIEAEIDYQSVTFVNADRWSTLEKVDRPTGEDEIIIVADEDSTDTADEEIAETPNMTSIKKESSMHTGGKLVPNPLATFRDPAAEKKTSNSLNNTHSESIKKEVTNKEKEVNEALPTHNNPSAQEIVGKTTIKEDVEKLSSFLKKAKKFIAESNQRHQSKQQQHIAEVSEDVLRYSRNKAPLSESIETNSTQMKPATQTLLNLAKQSQQSQMIKENTLKITGQPPHGKLRGIPDRPPEVNCIQRSNLPKVIKDTASVPNRTNSANLPHPIIHQQNRHVSPAHYDHLPKKGRNKVVRTSSTGPRVIGDKEPRQTVLRNAVPAEQNVSNPVNQLAQTYKQTFEDQSQQAYDVFIQTNSNVNKIIITNSKAATNAQRVPSIKSKNAIDAEQNFVNQANRLSELYKHWEQQLPQASREHLAQNVSADNVLVKTTTTGNPLNQHNVSQNNTISKVQNFPSMDQLPKASNQYLKPAVMQNNGRHVAHTRCVSLAGESAAANSLNQRPGFRDTRQNIPTALPNPQMNQPYQISKNSHENQTRPVIKAYLLQDPRTKLLFLKAATRVNDDERKPLVQSTTKKVPPAPQTVPSANQSNQPFNQSYKNQFAADSRDAELQNLRAQQIFQRRPNTMHGTSHNGYPQNSTENIPITVNPSYSATHQPCSCLCSHGRPVTTVTAKDPMAKQDPHVQISLISKSTTGNSGEHRVYPETDTDNRFAKKTFADEQQCTQENHLSVPQSICPQSSTRNKPAAHCSKDLANQQVELSMAEQNSPINVVSSDKVIFTEKAPVNKIISSKSPIESSLQTKATAIALKDKLHNTLHDYTLLFSQMNSNISGTLEACNDMQSTITEYNKSFKNIIGKVTDLCQLKIDQIHSIKSKKVEKPQNKLKRRKVMKDDDGDYLDEHQGNENNKSSKTNEECKKPLKKKRKQAKVQKEVNSFVLPPEYDPANSRWTLKHQKAAPGLVEVIPRGRVYIDAINFKYCKRTAKDCRTLARMLLTEIFSENALRVCSLTGARAKAYNDQDVRPGLDEQARIIMLTFVEDYGRKHDWVVCDTQSVINSVRSKLQEIRNRAN